MQFFRIFQHLLPTGHAWRVVIESTLRKFFMGLSEQPALTKAYVDDVYLDLFPETTRELNEWERQFGLSLTDMSTPAAVVAGRLALAAEWRATGGQSPSYIQGVLRAAGFDVYVYDWWSSGPPYVARDPRDYTETALVGIYQCTGDAFQFTSQPQCSDLPTQPQCNDWLANEVYYLVNKDLTRRAPPPVPDDPDTFPYWFYVAGATFGSFAIVDAARRDELERLVLKLRPLHLWVGMLINYVSGDEDYILAEDADPITTEDTDEPFLIE